METITNKSLKAQHVISKRMTTNMERFGIDLDVSYSELFGVINWDMSQVEGHIFVLFHNGRDNPKAMDVECCLPLAPAVTKIPEDISVRVIPSCIIALCATYGGNLDEIDPTYERIKTYAEQHYHKLAYPIREYYIDYSSQTPITEIAWPIAELL